jgi:mRNA deadenylase 3'-5' endonuclease subunit Ccr4
LRWSERRVALIEVLDELEADILCLQEVEDYDKFWYKELSAKGYHGVYKKRNSHRKSAALQRPIANTSSPSAPLTLGAPASPCPTHTGSPPCRRSPHVRKHTLHVPLPLTLPPSLLRYDGCATFYKADKFERIDVKDIEFDQHLPSPADMSPDFATHNIALITMFRPVGR